MVNRAPGRWSKSSSSAITQSIAYSGMIGAARFADAWLPQIRVAGSMKMLMFSSTFLTISARRITIGSSWCSR